MGDGSTGSGMTRRLRSACSRTWTRASASGVYLAASAFLAHAQHEEDAHADCEHRQTQRGDRHFTMAGGIEARDQNGNANSKIDVGVSEKSAELFVRQNVPRPYQ